MLQNVTAYAMQTGGKEEEKDIFWQGDTLARSRPKRSCGGEKKWCKCNGNHGYGTCNEEGERILISPQRTTEH
ncbi:unnamed protein product [Strongylus vulgaris]|uniref:Uncharacterized protein n=1 Tax=Strongylus vulgaris TaxID=40348 RepID=A0A3P7KCS2_STRVU|nr:unnamed protein product [Strongylus vulgaris]